MHAESSRLVIMNKPSRNDILSMGPDELDHLLNECLIPFCAEQRWGNRARHYSVNPVDAADAKAALRELGFKFSFVEFRSGCAAMFAKGYGSARQYDAAGETSEEIATARAAAITIVEQTDLFEQAYTSAVGT